MTTSRYRRKHGPQPFDEAVVTLRKGNTVTTQRLNKRELDEIIQRYRRTQSARNQLERRSQLKRR